MLLTLDVGNTVIFGGVFDQGQLICTFRKTSDSSNSSDEFGLFLSSVLKNHGVRADQITAVVFSSVVPQVVHSLSAACVRYFGVEPMILQAGLKTGLRIKYRNPLEVGSDRIANAIGATYQYPDENLIIIDCGTATTLCAVTRHGDYLGGTIVPGMKLAMQSLEQGTAKLSTVEIVKPNAIVGRSTAEGIRSGLYYGMLGMMKELVAQIKQEQFNTQPSKVIATGGFSRMFVHEGIFDVHDVNLVLIGLHQLYLINQKSSKPHSQNSKRVKV